jgi:hypothetical protein
MRAEVVKLQLAEQLIDVQLLHIPAAIDLPHDVWCGAVS